MHRYTKGLQTLATIYVMLSRVLSFTWKFGDVSDRLLGRGSRDRGRGSLGRSRGFIAALGCLFGGLLRLADRLCCSFGCCLAL